VNRFCFTVDDNIRFLKEICENKYASIFEHPYLAMYKRLHEELSLKVQLNLFYRMPGFDLSQMSDAYIDEWRENSSWLKLSFHSDYENVEPYKSSRHDEVYSDLKRVNDEIVRFAAPESLGKTTTIHYCLATPEGVRALSDGGVIGLLGLFGDADNPRTSYGINEDSAAFIRGGEVIKYDGISYGAIDIILNCFTKDEILTKLEGLVGREQIRVMIHEQYFYPDYVRYQPDFEDKLRATFAFLCEKGYKSSLFEEMI
jgi:hypothetical protein